uniref:diguanylate cyclase domain-containing protein n=1 Tax=uncultured Fretibacterium sp. TaxID=1678694 RepID=UPI0026212882
QRIRASLEAPACLEKTCYQIHASMGIAVYPQDGNEPSILLKHADNALYQAKNSGRNTYCFYTPPTVAFGS